MNLGNSKSFIHLCRLDIRLPPCPKWSEGGGSLGGGGSPSGSGSPEAPPAPPAPPSAPPAPQLLAAPPLIGTRQDISLSVSQTLDTDTEG